MWMLLRRQKKSPALLCALFIFLLLALHWANRFSNFSDLVSHAVSPAPNALPLSLQCNLGRLGNQMCTFATLYGISALNHRRFVALSCNVNKLKDIFIGPSEASTKLEALYLKWNSWSLLSYLRPEDAAIPPNFNFLDGFKYPCSYTFFDHVASEIRRQFRFKDYFIQYAQNVLRLANVQKLENVTYVGLHVRRGDYQKHWLEAFDGVPVNIEYFEKSLKYFREKYHNVIVVAVSDDRLWCTKELSKRFGVYVPKEAPTPAHDLAILASCNHTILTYGTFGFWGAYLAGGEVLYFDKFLRPNTSFTLENFIFDKMYPPRWKGIVTVNASHWLQGTASTAKNPSNATKKT